MTSMMLSVFEIVLTAGCISLIHSEEFSLETKNISNMMDDSLFLPVMDIWATFVVPLGHVTLVSFTRMSAIDAVAKECKEWREIVLYKGGKSNSDVAWTTCGYPVPLPEVYEAHSMHLRLTIKRTWFRGIEFRILYSFHQLSHRPSRAIGGLWNCSTPEWPKFERHFLCNLDTECEAREDEAPCFYTGHCGHDYLTLDGRCYSYVKSAAGKRPSWRDSVIECELRGGYLVSLNTHAEWQAVVDVIKSKVFKTNVHIGLRHATSSVPLMYRNALMWADKTVAFYLVGVDQEQTSSCAYFDDWKFDTVLGIRHNCDFTFNNDLICEFAHFQSVDVGKLNFKNKRLHFHTLPNDSFPVPVVTCPVGHLTLAFLACDEQSACWSSRHGYSEHVVWGVPSRAACPAPVTSLPVMFDCSSGLQRIPYSLVCDHRQQCVDKSDESFCVFSPCSGSKPLRCPGSSQCGPLQFSCNGQGECINGADEIQCNYISSGYKTSLSPPAVVNFPRGTIITQLGQLTYIITPLPEDSQMAEGLSPCPETHFLCPPDGYCLPVFVRCNGINDCPGREDEAGCDSDVSCPGFYRCRSSSVCLHPSHVCDGMYQCPQHEDELFCDLACPSGCTCHGLALTCPEPFHAGRQLDLRFVDASGSGLTPTELRYNTMLIHLSLSRCGLDSVHNMSFPNLRSLDLSHNKLGIITAEHLQGILNLQFLTLSNNPLKDLFPPNIEQFSYPVLKSLDLSGVVIKRLNTRIFAPFPGLQTLNLSHCDIDGVDGGGFHPTSKFRILDTVGCPLTRFPRDLLSRLDQLQAVYADNFRLCCPDTLPTAFNLANCEAPFDEVSSCESLLRSNVYTVFLSIFATLTLTGNFVCFVLRSFHLKSSTSGFVVFVTHLSISDFLMGVYLAVIGVADRQYKGDYQWNDFSWRHSTACQMAGFLSLMSNEVSAFIICLITLDRFLVLRFPFSSVHFTARSAHLTCLVVWVVAATVSVFPLTPMTSHWSFYSHTGICIPLPVTRGDFAGRQYAFGVLIVCNFILFVLIALGQAAIYVSVRANSLSTTDTTKKSNDLRLARRLISVAVSDFLCWFPVGLLGLLASSGVPISGEVNVGMAILVLPLNSAINPFLYTINVVLERRRRSRDQTLLEQLTMLICQEDQKTG